jgi:hypothetical protein
MLSFNPYCWLALHITWTPTFGEFMPHYSPQLVERWTCVSSPLLSHTSHRRSTGGSRGATQRGVRFDLGGVSQLTLWRQVWTLVRSIFIFYFVRLPLCSRDRRPTPARLSRPAVRQGGTAASPWSHPRWRSVHSKALSWYQWVRIASPARIQARGSPVARCTAPVILFSSLYHQKPYQDAWQSGLQCPDLQFSCDNLLIHL